jgi:COP9 signalosome complex subunit 8
MAGIEQQLAALVSSGDLDKVSPLCDEAELALGGPLPPDWPYALHMLGHMVKGDLESARFVHKRAPEGRKAADEELRAVFGRGRARRPLSFMVYRHTS